MYQMNFKNKAILAYSKNPFILTSKNMQKHYSEKHVVMLEESKKEVPTFCTIVSSGKGS